MSRSRPGDKETGGIGAREGAYVAPLFQWPPLGDFVCKLDILERVAYFAPLPDSRVLPAGGSAAPGHLNILRTGRWRAADYGFMRLYSPVLPRDRYVLSCKFVHPARATPPNPLRYYASYTQSVPVRNVSPGGDIIRIRKAHPIRRAEYIYVRSSAIREIHYFLFLYLSRLSSSRCNLEPKI